MAPSPKPTPFRLERLPGPAWEVVTFVATAAILLDLLLLTSWIVEGGTAPGGLGSAWKAVKAVVVVLMLLGIAMSLRSVGLAVAALLLIALFVEVSGLVGYPLGSELTRRLDLGALDSVIRAPPPAWGSFLAIGAITILTELVLTASGLSHSPLLRRACRVLATLLAILFAFAGVWALFAAAFPTLVLTTVAEFGTLLVMSLMVAVAGGVLRVAARWSAAKSTMARRRQTTDS